MWKLRERKFTVLIRLCRPLIHLLVLMSPKRHQAVFRSWPDFGDMAYTMIRGLKKHGIPTTVLTSRGAVTPSWAEAAGAEVMEARSIRGFIRYLCSEYVFYSHSLYFSSTPARNQVVIYLSHGAPMKRVGHDLKNSVQLVQKFDLTISSSDDSRGIIANSYGVPIDRVLNLGLPRNDLLANPELRPDVRRKLPANFVLWQPTYRTSAAGARRYDGDAVVALPNRLELNQICDALESNGMSLVVKLHPMAPLSDRDTYKSDDRVVFLDENWLIEHEATYYQILAESSGLITDYSSVAVDYLVTGCPVNFIMRDLDTYLSTRGLLYELEDLEKLGHISRTFSELAEHLSGEVFGPGESLELDPLFYNAPRSGATDRVIDMATSDEYRKTKNSG